MARDKKKDPSPRFNTPPDVNDTTAWFDRHLKTGRKLSLGECHEEALRPVRQWDYKARRWVVKLEKPRTDLAELFDRYARGAPLTREPPPQATFPKWAIREVTVRDPKRIPENVAWMRNVKVKCTFCVGCYPEFARSTQAVSRLQEVALRFKDTTDRTPNAIIRHPAPLEIDWSAGLAHCHLDPRLFTSFEDLLAFVPSELAIEVADWVQSLREQDSRGET